MASANKFEDKEVKLTPENFLNEYRNIENSVEEKYGRLGTAIVTGKEFVWKFENVPVNANEAKKKELNSTNNIIRQKKQDYEENKSKAMATLKKHLSDVARSRLENHVDYQQTVDDADPIKFWKIIQEVLKKSGGANAEVQRSLERDKLVKLKQNKGEKMEDFTARFAKQNKVCQQLGINIDSGEIIRTFIDNIDQSRYKYFFDRAYDKQDSERTWDWIRTLAIEAESREKLDQRRDAVVASQSKNTSTEGKPEGGNLIGLTKHLPAGDEGGRDKKRPRYQGKKRFCNICKKNDRPSMVIESHNTDKCYDN